jgi:hypothetical protein
MTATELWTCPTCKALVPTPFCPTCGEHPLQARELTLRGLAEQIFEAFTNIDGRLIRSLRALVFRPGALTVAFLNGRRKPYIGPVTLFLIANVLFFAMESLSGGTIFTAPLQSHLHTQPWSDFAQPLVTQRLQAKHTTLALYAPAFDKAIGLNARSLIIFMALSFALAPFLVFFRSRLPLMAHAVFALHFYAFVLLLLSVATTMRAVGLWLGSPVLLSNGMDYVLSIVLLIACAVYLYVAVRTVHHAQGASRILKTFALTLAVAVIVIGYRFILLLITLYST